ncbi:hypothetical protein ONZ45_g10887 [Pleurotus djamor]|nr:hypothetical protein ONZ45_g10887 [Pleurotus djamor]
MNPSHAVFGTKGDFVTSPEISQVFGELIGIWFLSQWSAAGQPSSIRIVELGPGRGTLMSDILRVISKIPAARVLENKSLVFVESSPSMRQLQEDNLARVCEDNHWSLRWEGSIEDIPADENAYTFILAHEFFDALPIHKLTKVEGDWREIMVASQPGANEQPELCAAVSPSPSPVSALLAHSSPRFASLPPGSKLEVSPASFKVSRTIGELIAASSKGGSALVVDYGGDKAFGDSFRAFKDHRPESIFHRPGECDLTANVDFAYLREAAADFATSHGPISQATFLEGMGVYHRAKVLVQAAASAERAQNIQHDIQRLVDPLGMGTQYQVMCFSKSASDHPTPTVYPFVS